MKPDLSCTERTEGNTEGRPDTLQDTIRAYIAGFPDGDGSIHFQLVRRRDYVYGYQIRVSVCFYQSTRGKAGLEWLKEQLGCGYLRDRAGDMSEYTIVGWSHVRRVLELVQPFVIFKREQVARALEHTFQPRVDCYARKIPRKRKAGRCICNPKLFEAQGDQRNNR